MMPIDEEAVTKLEAEIPELAQRVFQEAYQQALARGLSVVVAEGGSLVEVFPDGRKEFCKLLEPKLAVVKGTVVEIV